MDVFLDVIAMGVVLQLGVVVRVVLVLGVTAGMAVKLYAAADVVLGVSVEVYLALANLILNSCYFADLGQNMNFLRLLGPSLIPRLWNF